MSDLGVGTVAVLPGTGDGEPDLVIADDLANNVQVLMNSYLPGSANSQCATAPALTN